jgi:glycosyltransferase involved in cell wall biosynthesis
MSIHRLTRAAYFLSWGYGNEAGPADGVRRKIGEQIRRWRSLGLIVRLFINARRDCRDAWLKEVEANELFISIGASRSARWRSLNYVCNEIDRFAPDFVYLRQELFAPRLAKMMQRWPSFVELNGDDVAEARRGPVRQSYYWMYRAVSRGAFFRRATGLVAVSRELAGLAPFAQHHLPTAVIANGIDLSRFEPLPAPESKGLRFGFIGAALGARWHGAPKIVDIARLRPDWSFDIIGLSAADFDGPLPPNITAHGVLDRPQYERVLARCDVGLGTLSAYEKQAWEASPLKVRQYLAFGIPTITGVTDTDYPHGADFLLVLPNTPDNLVSGIDEIETFAKRWKGKRVPREHVTDIDVQIKEARRIDFVKGVLARSPAAAHRLTPVER